MLYTLTDGRSFLILFFPLLYSSQIVYTDWLYAYISALRKAFYSYFPTLQSFAPYGEMLYLPSASALRQTFYGSIAFKSRFVGMATAVFYVYILMGKVVLRNDYSLDSPNGLKFL